VFTVVIPWRPKPDREQALADVRAWYAQHVPDATIRLVDTDDAVFNLARCRNTGAASVDPDDVVVLNDADTLPEHDALLAAVAAARTSGRVQLPYDRYHWLGAEGTAQFRAGTPLPDCDFTLVHGACSGVYVTTRRTWEAHGGQDERFRGWGFEDAAWNLAHTTLLGAPPQRHEGRVYALHHVAEVRNGPQYDANADLMERYRAASVSPEAMRALVSEPARA
jgi:hypothetical protein